MTGREHRVWARGALAVLLLTAGACACALLAGVLRPSAAAAPGTARVWTGLRIVGPYLGGVLGALLGGLLRRKAAHAVCPACRARRVTKVGPVGAYRNARRCRACGFLW